MGAARAQHLGNLCRVGIADPVRLDPVHQVMQIIVGIAVAQVEVLAPLQIGRQAAQPSEMARLQLANRIDV